MAAIRVAIAVATQPAAGVLRRVSHWRGVLGDEAGVADSGSVAAGGGSWASRDGGVVASRSAGVEALAGAEALAGVEASTCSSGETVSSCVCVWVPRGVSWFVFVVSIT